MICPHQEEHPEEHLLDRSRVLRDRADAAGFRSERLHHGARRYSEVRCQDGPGSISSLRTYVATVVANHLKWRAWTISVERPFLMLRTAATRSLTKIA